MRKISLLAIAGLMLSITSCSLQLPEKVSAKTNANYNLFIGNIEKNLNFSTAIPGAYDYFPGSTNANLQQYLVPVTLYDKRFNEVEAFSTLIQAVPDGSTLDCATLPAIQGSETAGFNPSDIKNTIKTALGDDFANKISFDSVPIYLYCYLSGNLTAQGRLKLYYGDKDTKVACTPNSYPLWIIGESGYENIEIKTRPALPSSTSETVVRDFSDDTTYSFDSDLATIMNNTVTTDNSGLCINYDFKFGGNISKEDVTSGNARIKIEAVIVIPVKFNVSDEITMDLKSLAGITGDLLGRTSASGNNDISRYTEALRSVSFIYETQEKPFESSGEVKFHFDVNNDGNVSLTEKYSFSQGAVTLTADDLERIMTTVPYSPEMTVKIPAGTFSIKRTKNLKMNLGISLVTDGEIPLKQ